MRQLTQSLRHGALALCLLPALAFAQHGPGPMERPSCAMAPADGHDGPSPEGMHRRPFGHGGFHHLGLDEAQQDKLFALDHEQQPKLRLLHRQTEKAHRALAELGRSGQYSEAKARPLADSLAQAQAELALMRARFDSGVFAILTPEQRARLAGPGCGPEHVMRRSRAGGNPISDTQPLNSN